MKNNVEDRLLWMLAGIGLGAGVALLLAPKTGRDTRRYLAKLAEEGRDRIVDGSQEFLDKGKQAVDRGRAVVDGALDFVERGRRIIAR